MFFVNYLPEFLYQSLKLSNVRPTDFANSKHALIPLANNAENEITEIMNCSKSTANSSGSCKRNDTDGIC